MGKEKVEQLKLRLTLLKENFEYQDFFHQFIEWEKNKFPGVWPGSRFNEFGLFGLRFLKGLPPSLSLYEKALDLINPQNELNSFPEDLINKILPRAFHDPAISFIELKGSDPKIIIHFNGSRTIPIDAIIRIGLKPWEKIFKVDLSKKKSQILKEFEQYLDWCYSNNREIQILNSKRDRKETWMHLEVWKLRKKRKSFSQISKTLNITQDAAKKSFYRAYELTQGKKYDPEILKKEIWIVKKTEIKQLCNSCLKKKECETLCPNALRHANQDKIKLREKLLSDPSFLENPSLSKHRRRAPAAE